jgi:hypothetical protein
LKIRGPRLDFTEGQGANCKIGGDFLAPDYFSMGKYGGLGHGRLKGLARACPSGPSGVRRLATGGAMERGVHGESISGLTRARAAEWRPGDGGEELVVVAPGGGGARAWREEKESGERCGGVRWGFSIYIGAKAEGSGK